MLNNDSDPKDLPTRKLGDPGNLDRTDDRPFNDPNAGEFSIEDLSGRVLGRYRLLESLGRGGFGVVYKAEDQVLRRHVAIKLLTRFQSGDQVDAWLEEARMLAGLDHPAIVPVYDVGKTDTGQPYIVSKIIDGGSLERRIEGDSWALEDSVRVTCQLARALDYLHRRGVIHRDVKPSNILTTPDGNAVLADFGLAMPESGFGRGSRFVGTPAYMSPEQARHEGHRVDGRSDIYSLGVVFYQLLCGRRPFQAIDREQLLDCIRNVEVRPPRQIRPGIPRELERICLKALSKRVSERYATAGDLADELDEWLNEKSPKFDSRRPDVTASPAASTLVSSSRSLDLDHVAVVPHGLRAFDADDADFFRWLLPGPYDRHGIPESIRFWTRNILSRSADDVFRVGVLLGPSGSGKSSLMRAGVIPFVRERTATVFVEAKPDQLEQTLAKQLRRLAPEGSTTDNLPDLIAEMRQSQGTTDGKKILIVIDQFEQWLNHHRPENASLLREALRQCDGVSVQAILIVRDDFVLGITSFMDELEESMRQNWNFATIEPFGVQHAKQVLAAFGRAYGAISDPPSPSQIAFLDESVRGLEALGRIAPLQIALLAEMTKGKPWSLQTLKELGGIQGLGVAFLEEKLSGLSAHPILRTNPLIVRRILVELLPPDNTVIKPPAILESELLQRLEGMANEEMLRRILQLLDTEVRLITPTSGARSVSSSQSGSSTSDPAYQLTHDYLVPTTRTWLAQRLSETRSGRIRELLRELAVTWNSKPSAKRLPAFSEWLSIRWFTKPSEWTLTERRMMQTCDRRFARIAAVTFLITGSLLFSSWAVIQHSYAKALSTRLAEADLSQVLGVVEEIEQYRKTFAHHLIGFPGDENGNAVDTGDSSESSQMRLQRALAQSTHIPEQARYVLDHLPEIPDRHLEEISKFLAQRSLIDDKELAERLQNSLDGKDPQGLAYAAVFAQRKPDDARWEDWGNELATLLLDKQATQVAYWTELLRPVKRVLVPALTTTGEQLRISNSNKTDTARALISNLAIDQPEYLAQAAKWTPVSEIPRLVADPAIATSVAEAARAELSQLTALPHPIANNSLDPALIAKVAKLTGFLHSTGGWMEQVPIAEVPDVTRWMRDAGYRPVSLRPYRAKDQSTVYAAMAWQLGTEPMEMVLGASQAELEERFQTLQRDGWTMLDFASLMNPSNSSLHWFGIWCKLPDTAASAQHFVLGVSVPEQEALSSDALYNDWVSQRFDARVQPDGDLVYDMLLVPIPNEVVNAYDDIAGEAAVWSRLLFAAGDLYPGLKYADARCAATDLLTERARCWDDFHYYMERAHLAEGNQKPLNLAAAATRLADAGDAVGALEILSQIDEGKIRQPRTAETDRILEYMLRARGNAFYQRKDLESLSRLVETEMDAIKGSSAEKQLIRLRYAALKDDPIAASEALEYLEKRAEDDDFTRQRLLRALGIIASQDWGDTSRQAFERLKDVGSAWLKKYPDIFSSLFCSDLDGLRAREDWIAWKRSQRFDYRICSSAFMKLDCETRLLVDIPSDVFRQTVLPWCEEGFLPKALHARCDSYGNRFITSVWEGRKRKPAEEARHARRITGLALVLGHLGQSDAILDGLRERWGRTVRTALIEGVPKVLTPQLVVNWLQTESSPSMQATYLEILGTWPLDRFVEADRTYLRSRIPEMAESASDARVANVAIWCCKQWQLEPPKHTGSSTLRLEPNRNWYVNSLGHQMVVLRANGKRFLSGKEGYPRIWNQLDRDFAIATNEVTGDDYAEFLKDPRVMRWIEAYPKGRATKASHPGMPQQGLSWDLAIHFCQWLNERDGVPEDQWCYENLWQAAADEHPLPRPDNLSRTGYRPPTYPEWMYACMSESNTPWHFGSDESHVAAYEWTMPHSENRPHPIASLRPNAFGLFDMGGNLAEWTEGPHRSVARDSGRFFLLDERSPKSNTEKYYVIAGGRFRFTAQSAMSESQSLNERDYISISTGLRVARTIKP